MKKVRAPCLIWLVVMLVGNSPAQSIFQHLITNNFEDMAEVKRLAESGDARAQYKLANTLAMKMQSADALGWYLKAAQQGDLESYYQAGRMLLYGGIGLQQGQGVAAKLEEGIVMVFRAATNGHNAAFHDMYRAYADGRGVPKDMGKAYAWLQLHVDTARGILPSPARVELNQLALNVDVATSQEGKRLAALYRSGHWPVLVVQAVPPPQAKPAAIATAPPPTAAPKAPAKPMPSLKLSAIAQGQTPTAVINGKLLSVGETVTVPAKPQNCVVKCLKIEKESVLVSVDGEPEPLELRLR